jgi:large conductance mechanosensitive channel
MSQSKTKATKGKAKQLTKVDISPAKIVQAGESQAKNFFDFIRSQGVLGLAVGLVLGGAVGVLVKSLVDNIVMPPIGLVMGSAEGLKGLSWTIGTTTNGQPAILYYGNFLNDFVNFIVIALVIYFIVRILHVDPIAKKK